MFKWQVASRLFGYQCDSFLRSIAACILYESRSSDLLLRIRA
jgi:hypothetical protein